MSRVAWPCGRCLVWLHHRVMYGESVARQVLRCKRCAAKASNSSERGWRRRCGSLHTSA